MLNFVPPDYPFVHELFDAESHPLLSDGVAHPVLTDQTATGVLDFQHFLKHNESPQLALSARLHEPFRKMVHYSCNVAYSDASLPQCHS